jgi:hypothetical protein
MERIEFLKITVNPRKKNLTLNYLNILGFPDMTRINRNA